MVPTNDWHGVIRPCHGLRRVHCFGLVWYVVFEVSRLLLARNSVNYRSSELKFYHVRIQQTHTEERK